MATRQIFQGFGALAGGIFITLILQPCTSSYEYSYSRCIVRSSLFINANRSLFAGFILKWRRRLIPSASMSSAQRLICKQRAVLIAGTDVKHQGASDPSGLRQ